MFLFGKLERQLRLFAGIGGYVLNDCGLLLGDHNAELFTIAMSEKFQMKKKSIYADAKAWQWDPILMGGLFVDGGERRRRPMIRRPSLK